MRAGSLVIVIKFHWNQLKQLEDTLGFDMVDRRRRKKKKNQKQEAPVLISLIPVCNSEVLMIVLWKSVSGTSKNIDMYACWVMANDHSKL